MADTTFVDGTVIEASWLNDVNDTVYGLPSTASAANGDALVGVLRTFTGAVATTQHNVNESRYIGLRSDLGCDDGDDVTAELQAALDAASGNNITVDMEGVAGIVSAAITITGTGDLTLAGPGKITCAATSDAENVLRAVSKSRIVVRDIEFDINGAARVADHAQTVRYLGPFFSSCTDCTFENVTVRGTRGFGGISSVGIAIGQGTRIKINNCRIIDCGTSVLTSDAVYSSGIQTLITNCIAINCTDTAFVLEDSDFSGISGCTSYDCGSPAAITVSLSTDRRGNFINGYNICIFSRRRG